MLIVCWFCQRPPYKSKRELLTRFIRTKEMTISVEMVFIVSVGMAKLYSELVFSVLNIILFDQCIS